MYVAVKGGEAAILNSYELLAQQRRGDPNVPEISVVQPCSLIHGKNANNH